MGFASPVPSYGLLGLTLGAAVVFERYVDAPLVALSRSIGAVRLIASNRGASFASNSNPRGR
jgi:hypothetical protein